MKRLVRLWSAKIPPQEMAMHMVSDLCKKFRQLDAMPTENFEIIAQGLVDGLKGTTFAYPGGGGIPDYRRSMNPDYCAGFEVGNTWRRVAHEWPETENSLPNVKRTHH
jgi:hypothetical protein